MFHLWAESQPVPEDNLITFLAEGIVSDFFLGRVMWCDAFPCIVALFRHLNGGTSIRH
jgi:hypothetical protein